MLNLGKFALLAFQSLGLFASVFLVAVTLADSDQVEARLQSFAISKVEAATEAALIQASANLGSTDRATRLGAFAQSLGLKADAIDQKRQQIVPALLAFSLSDRCGDNCGIAALGGIAINSALLEKTSQLRVGQQTLGQFIVNRYDTTLRGLILDLRRFGLVNVVTLALMSALLIFKNILNWRFAALSVGVTGYATWAAYGYVYTQDWARTILFQNWAADGYQIAMILVCCVLSDWLFLRGKITETVLNAITSALPG